MIDWRHVRFGLFLKRTPLKLQKSSVGGRVQGGPAKVRPSYIFAGTWMCR